MAIGILLLLVMAWGSSLFWWTYLRIAGRQTFRGHPAGLLLELKSGDLIVAYGIGGMPVSGMLFHSGPITAQSWSHRLKCSIRPVHISSVCGEGAVIPLYIPFVLITVTLAAGRLRDRRRRPAHGCRECGYNLIGNVSGICPECGTVIARLIPEPSAMKHQESVPTDHAD